MELIKLYFLHISVSLSLFERLSTRVYNTTFFGNELDLERGVGESARERDRDRAIWIEPKIDITRQFDVHIIILIPV